MAKNKTTETADSVPDFINTVADETKRNDCFRIGEIIKSQTQMEPKMWGPAIVGFGSYHYKYESGREGDAPLIGFSPRKNAITLYMSSSFNGRADLLTKLGRHKIGGGCIYVNKLSDINEEVLRRMITDSVAHMCQVHPDHRK